MSAYKEPNTEDQQLMDDLLEVSGGDDIHGVNSIICLFSSSISLGWKDKADLYRRQIRAYIARCKLGEKIAMHDIRKEIIE